MRKIFRKAITVLGSAALIGMTVGAASAAAYPAPFTSNTAIVVGANAAPSDNIAASSIASNLDASATATTTGTTTGESASLASGSDLLYLNDEFNENVQTLTKSDLPTVLADGTFADDDGTEYNYEQTLTISKHADNNFAFTNSDNDLDDPALALELSTSTAYTIYNLTATFNKAVNFSATASEGSDIILFGKTYTVGTATDADTLVLLGGAASAIVNVGESKTITVNGIPYTIVLNGLSSAAATAASITVNGETKTFTQGQSKAVGGIDAYAKTVFRTGDDGSGYVEVQLGAGKLTLEDASAVMEGTDTDDIDGTLVAFTGTAGDVVGTLTKIVISVAAEDNDVNHLLVGESFVDPVFGTVLVNFDGVENGPVFTGEKDKGRTELEIRKGGNQELLLELTDNAGDTATVPFTYVNETEDDDGKTIHLVEGDDIADDEYFILNSGSNHHYMQITKLNIAGNVSTDDVAMKDLLSGTTYTFDNHNFTAGYDATISGQTYTITAVSTSAVTVVSSDYGTGIANGDDVDVFPVIELVSGEDTRVAITDNVTALTNFISGGTADSKTVTLNLPTGTATVSNSATNTSIRLSGTASTVTEVATGDELSVAVGDVFYNFAVVGVAATNATTVTVAVDDTPSEDSSTAVTTPGILFVEDEDKSDGTTKPAVHIVTTDNGAYSTVESPVFSGKAADTDFDTETWDDTDFTGWLTNYGTYIWKDTGDTNQNFVGLSYGDDMMYAEVSISEGEAATADDVGVVTVTDANVASAAGKNLVVVGGSAINSVAAELLGAAYSEAAFTTATGVAAGEFMIQSFSRAGKTALLVAGYNAADTEKATTYLLNNAVTTTTGTKYKGTSATEASLVVA